MQESGDKQIQIARDKYRWDEMLQHSPIIAAIRSAEALQTAIISPIKIIYLLFGNPMNIAKMIESVRVCGKLPLVNADLLQGFSRDAHAGNISPAVVHPESSPPIMRHCAQHERMNSSRCCVRSSLIQLQSKRDAASWCILA